jgi:hypothetical protein
VASVRRCSTCGINYPPNPATFPVCRVCGGQLDGIMSAASGYGDWEDDVRRATAGARTFLLPLDDVAVSEDEHGRLWVDGLDLVRAGVCHSADQLARMAAADPALNGLPLVTIRGRALELQGYDRPRRRWWAIELPPLPES